VLTLLITSTVYSVSLQHGMENPGSYWFTTGFGQHLYSLISGSRPK